MSSVDRYYFVTHPFTYFRVSSYNIGHCLYYYFVAHPLTYFRVSSYNIGPVTVSIIPYIPTPQRSNLATRGYPITKRTYL